ncbi:hypothetical protein VTK56DRAFT_7294 [Thermocarpiscus australiensis]
MAEVEKPAKKKALPFKRTVARTQQQSSGDTGKADDDNDLDLFRHSKDVFPEIIREVEEEERDQEHARKRRKVSEEEGRGFRTDRSLSRLTDRSRSPSPLKRSSFADGSDDDLIMDVKGKGKEIIRASTTSTPGRPFSRRSTSHISLSPAAPTIVIDDDDSDDIKPVKSPTRRREASKLLTPRRRDFQSSDDLSTEPVGATRDSDTEVEEVKPAEEPPDEFSEWVARAREMQAQSQHAVVNCFVTSRLPGATKPVLVKRRLKQGIQLILETWIAKQRSFGADIPDDVARSLFLTWKENKIYNHSTLASLGVQVDADGNLKMTTSEGYLRDGLHLEVWTEEAYTDYLNHRGRERSLRLGILDDDQDLPESQSEEEPPPVQQKKKKGIRVVLKAKDHEPVKLTTKDGTTVGIMIEAFRNQRDIGPQWDVAIYFDGEKLDDDSLVEDADIDPDETNQMEVHIKKRGQ